MRSAALAFLAVLLLTTAACAPARTGMVGNALTTNTAPTFSLSANAPLALAGSGRLWVAANSSPRLMAPPLASLDYALFSSAPFNGPVTDSAHIFVLRVDENSWQFAPDSWPTDFTGKGTHKNLGKDAVGWASQVMCTPAANDWISDAWTANEREVPEFWLTKRWASIERSGVKIVLEYREPWPQGLESLNALDLVMADDDAIAALQGFLERAGAAFTVSAEFLPMPEQDGGKAMILPATTPDTARLIGNILSRNLGLDGRFRL